MWSFDDEAEEISVPLRQSQVAAEEVEDEEDVPHQQLLFDSETRPNYANI